MNVILAVLLMMLHLLVCALIYFGIELKILKVKRYLMPFVVLVPITGAACCLILHFQLFFRQVNKTAPAIEKMKNDQEIYQSIVEERKDSQRKVIPLEEALIVNDAKTRRNLIMDVLNDHPEQYVDVLMQARMNEDTEVAHYATTSMVELSKSYDKKLRQMESELKNNPEDEVVLQKLCVLLKNYLRQNIAKGKIQTECRERYSSLLEQHLQHSKTLPLFTDLVENELDLKHFEKAATLLGYMKKSWQDEEKYQMLLLRYYVEMKQIDNIRRQIAYIDEKNIYITQENRKKLDYWRAPENEKETEFKENREVSL